MSADGTVTCADGGKQVMRIGTANRVHGVWLADLLGDLPVGASFTEGNG